MMQEVEVKVEILKFANQIAAAGRDLLKTGYFRHFYTTGACVSSP